MYLPLLRSGRPTEVKGPRFTLKRCDPNIVTIFIDNIDSTNSSAIIVSNIDTNNIDPNIIDSNCGSNNATSSDNTATGVSNTNTGVHCSALCTGAYITYQ